MKAYQESWLKNRYALRLAKQFQQDGHLTSDQLEAIQQSHTDLPYSPNIFIKLLLFIFGLIGFSFGGAFFAIFLVGDTKWGIPITYFVYGIITLVVLIQLIKNRKLYNAGIDNALIYCILGSLIPLFFKISEINNFKEPWVLGLLFLPFLASITYAFGEPVVALGLLFDLMFIFSSLLIKHPIGKTFLPFILLGLLMLLYLVVRKFSEKKSAFYWQLALSWVSPVILILGYASINYMVVRYANASLNNLPLPAPEIRFSWLFWGLTFLIPLLQLWLGIRWRDRMMLVVAFLCSISSIFTYRHYHSVLPTEWGLILGGAILGLGAYFLYNYLKQPKGGFSVTPEESTHTLLHSFVLSQLTKSNQAITPQELKMGGGDFGGGGAGENY